MCNEVVGGRQQAYGGMMGCGEGDGMCVCVVVGSGAVEGGAVLLTVRVGCRCGLEGVLGGVLWVR